MVNSPLPRPLSELALGTRQAVVGVITDIDDTLTRDGRITPSALAALHDLAAAGLTVIAVTGRSLGWCRSMTEAWPLAAVVAENGGVALVPTGATVLTEYADDAMTVAANARRLRDIGDELLSRMPQVRLAADSDGRETDIAVDHGEFARLAPSEIRRVVEWLLAAGLTVSVSSIHVNAWFGTHSKWTAAQWMVRRLLQRELARERQVWAAIGDSPNDHALFENLPLSVGVANLMHFADQIRIWPGWITRGERGDGFAELARALLDARPITVRGTR
jgi:HAD superfamily hydrolase (TIGR01484 family)